MSTFDSLMNQLLTQTIQNDLYVDNEGNVKYRNPIIYPVRACIYHYCNSNNIVFLISNYNTITEFRKKTFLFTVWGEHNIISFTEFALYMDPKTLYIRQSQRQATKLKLGHLTRRIVQQMICQSGSSF